MSVWGKVIGTFAGAYFGGPLFAVAGAFAGHYVVDKNMENEVAFTIALIALSAKMAKADGIVSPIEVEAFYQICRVPEKEHKNVARIYRLAQEDIAGFETYARQVREIFEETPKVCEDVLDGLFHIAYADGGLHVAEEAFLRRISDIFRIKKSIFVRIHARHTPDITDPYLILGVDPESDNAVVKGAFLEAVRENHPDQIIARGVPQDIMHLAHDRMVVINEAWAMIRKERGL